MKNILLDMLYPPVCMLCGRLLETSTGLCSDCKKKVKWIREPRCLCCGKPLLSDTEEYCEDCREYPRAFDGGLGVFPYQNVIGKAVLDLKNRGKRENAPFLGACMALALQPRLTDWQPMCILPIPLTRKKLRRRGYNQAELLARELEKRLNIPLNRDILYRQKDGREQKSLHRFARRRNQEDVFGVRKGILPECVLLVDDIYTTGNTLEAASRELKKAGVKRVYFVTVCMGADF